MVAARRAWCSRLDRSRRGAASGGGGREQRIRSTPVIRAAALPRRATARLSDARPGRGSRAAPASTTAGAASRRGPASTGRSGSAANHASARRELRRPAWHRRRCRGDIVALRGSWRDASQARRGSPAGGSAMASDEGWLDELVAGRDRSCASRSAPPGATRGEDPDCGRSVLPSERGERPATRMRRRPGRSLQDARVQGRRERRRDGEDVLLHLEAVPGRRLPLPVSTRSTG